MQCVHSCPWWATAHALAAGRDLKPQNVLLCEDANSRLRAKACLCYAAQAAAAAAAAAAVAARAQPQPDSLCEWLHAEAAVGLMPAVCLPVADFGIARFKDASCASTKTGLAGTPQYMERARQPCCCAKLGLLLC